MARSKSNQPADAKPDVTPPQPTWFERIFRPRWILGSALLSVIAVLAPWVIRQLPDLKELPEYQLAFSQIQVDPPPTGGIPADLVSRVQLRGGLPDKLSLLDPKLPQTVAEAFAMHPWIERVVEVRNIYPALVKVQVEYRQPVAVVLVKSGLYPVDGKGVLLPPADFSDENVGQLIPVHGVMTTPYAPEGRPWSDPAVMAAADLASYLGSRWRELQLTAIIVARPESAATRPDEIPLELETAGGSRILWGRRPASQHPGELTGEQKLGRVQKYLAEFAAFDRPAGPYEIDIRHWDEISRRPLPVERLPINTATQRPDRSRR
jgi:hypothetical protein